MLITYYSWHIIIITQLPMREATDCAICERYTCGWCVLSLQTAFRFLYVLCHSIFNVTVYILNTNIKLGLPVRSLDFSLSPLSPLSPVCHIISREKRERECVCVFVWCATRLVGCLFCCWVGFGSVRSSILCFGWFALPILEKRVARFLAVCRTRQQH